MLHVTNKVNGLLTMREFLGKNVHNSVTTEQPTFFATLGNATNFVLYHPR